MTWEAIAYLLGLLISGSLTFYAVWCIIMLSDLESDYINPVDLCSTLNAWVVPEVFLHSGLFTVFLLNGQWIPALLNLPLLVWNINKMASETQFFDPTLVFRHLPQYKKEGIIKAVFFLTCFFYYLYGMIVTLVNENLGLV
ncbi:hypothetical protein H4R33_006292 [Dimargaris cristalligena]|uniref:Cornichon n=1 Tax=Dimargaris cristalligena TaxID=215637 RepID=A0A4P9ZS78_9FUNG|nr:hypothetical protein H4R33_006292 [Dimargaris cristalligena]RKP35320.1 cornichon [Dimargaris cristalligena]|eukprot:RKP35320.1 cornichon [Dimargaris cristalligena]